MAVQKRNSELVDLLSPDFIRKSDGAYVQGILAGIYLSIPGLVALWPMGISLSDNNDLYAQSLTGGTGSGDDLTLRSTSHATKGNIFFGTSTYDEVNNRLGIKTTNPSRSIQNAGTYYGSATDANWTTDSWGKALELTVETMIQWLKGGGSISRGIGFSADGNLYFTRSAADDASAAAVHDMVMDSSGNLYLGASGGFVSVGGRLGETWTNVTYNTGWVDYGASHFSVSYKKVGDLVFLRGLAMRTSGSSTIICTLPSGYRPSKGIIFPATSNYLYASIDISTSGVIVMVGGDPTIWVALDGIVFSTL